MRWSGGVERSALSDEVMRALIDDQFPWLADRELGRRYTLEDHLSVRIGDDYGAIFPRFEHYDPLYSRVSNLVTPYARKWTFPASFPVATGVPGHGYPYHWVVVEWLSGSTAGFVPLHGESAWPVGEAIREIHARSAEDAPTNPLVGVGLAALRPEFEKVLANAVKFGAPENRVVDAAATRALFEAGAALDVNSPRTWTHGRLEPRAVLSDRGLFGGILLWHNFGAGDPAGDLGFAANLLSLKMRDDFWAGYGGVDEPTAARALSFQLYAALRYIESDDPFLLRMAWERLLELELAHEA